MGRQDSLLQTEWKTEAQELERLLKSSRHTVFFGGAGVSTESGVPDFRSAAGIYSQERGAERILTPGFLYTRPRDFYDFYRRYFILEGIEPNACHRKLADWERRHLLQAVITQNVDNLHQAAGSQRVYELHGSGQHFSCCDCGSCYPLRDVLPLMAAHPQGLPCCSCGGLLRPDIVLYEEGLDQSVLLGAMQEIAQADLLIIGGTSLTVYPAAGLVDGLKPGARTVLIDRVRPSRARSVDLYIQAPLGAFFACLDY